MICCEVTNDLRRIAYPEPLTDLLWPQGIPMLGHGAVIERRTAASGAASVKRTSSAFTSMPSWCHSVLRFGAVGESFIAR